MTNPSTAQTIDTVTVVLLIAIHGWSYQGLIQISAVALDPQRAFHDSDYDSSSSSTDSFWQLEPAMNPNPNRISIDIDNLVLLLKSMIVSVGGCPACFDTSPNTVPINTFICTTFEHDTCDE